MYSQYIKRFSLSDGTVVPHSPLVQGLLSLIHVRSKLVSSLNTLEDIKRFSLNFYRIIHLLHSDYIVFLFSWNESLPKCNYSLLIEPHKITEETRLHYLLLELLM